jgi:hypothetical protein
MSLSGRFVFRRLLRHIRTSKKNYIRAANDETGPNEPREQQDWSNRSTIDDSELAVRRARAILQLRNPENHWFRLASGRSVQLHVPAYLIALQEIFASGTNLQRSLGGPPLLGALTAYEL